MRAPSVVLALLGTALAAQPSAPSASPAALRSLPWGQLNFLQTTDTHGWHAGHLQEAQYSADWGDYISFAKHLRDRADADGSDLLVVDCGDRIEGNGLYDASDPRGKYTFDIFTQQQVDIIVAGNHELYKAESSNDEYLKTVPAYKNSYLASNLDILNPKTGRREALAPRFRKFTTKNQGIRVVAFGFLFDFRGNANNTIVIPVEETIKQQWFVDAISDKDVDLFVVAGHVPVRDSLEYDALYKAIRTRHWDTPIQFFGGHTHIRDYTIYDKASTALESGRYMETIGFQSITGLGTSKSAAVRKSPIFQRLYIDNNLYSLHTHAGLNETTFPTEQGRNVSRMIASARKELNLDKAFGCAPRDLWLNRAPYPANDSLVSWLDQDVLPWIGYNLSASTSPTKVSPTIVLTNTGAMRFDIFKGPFTIDSTFLVSPFTSGLRRLKGVPYEKANKILALLNNQGPIVASELLRWGKGEVQSDATPVDGDVQRMMYRLLPPAPPQRAQLSPQAPLYWRQRPLVLSTDLTPGYTTHDDASHSSPGDDTPHAPIAFYAVPNAVGASVGIDAGSPPEVVDVVYNEFIDRWIVLALRYLGEGDWSGKAEGVGDGRSLTQFLSLWIELHWPCA